MTAPKRLDKNTLLGAALEQEDVKLSIGIIRVRALSRGEVFRAQQAEDAAATEIRLLAAGLVEPAMEEADVKGWYETGAFGDIRTVLEVLFRLSGLEPGASKSGPT